VQNYTEIENKSSFKGGPSSLIDSSTIYTMVNRDKRKSQHHGAGSEAASYIMKMFNREQ